MADAAHPNWILRHRLLVLAVVAVVVLVVILALLFGFVFTSSSGSTSQPPTTASTSTPQSSGACSQGGSCGYDNVTATNAVEIIANQTTGPGSLKSCAPTSGEAAALKGTRSSEWDCVNATTGATATYTINANGSVDY